MVIDGDGNEWENSSLSSCVVVPEGSRFEGVMPFDTLIISATVGDGSISCDSEAVEEEDPTSLMLKVGLRIRSGTQAPLPTCCVRRTSKRTSGSRDNAKRSTRLLLLPVLLLFFVVFVEENSDEFVERSRRRRFTADLAPNARRIPPYRHMADEA